MRLFKYLLYVITACIAVFVFYFYSSICSSIHYLRISEKYTGVLKLPNNYLEHLEDSCISSLNSHYIKVFSIHFTKGVGEFSVVSNVLVTCRHGYDRGTNGCVLGYGGTVQGVVEPRPVIVDIVDDDGYCCTC